MMTKKDSLKLKPGMVSNIIITFLSGLLILSLFIIVNNSNKAEISSVSPAPSSAIITDRTTHETIDFFTGNKDGFYYTFGAFNAIGSSIKNHETDGSYNSINEVINNINSFGIAQADVINNLPLEKKEQIKIIPAESPLFVEKVFFMYSSAKYPVPNDLTLTKYGFLHKRKGVDKFVRYNMASHLKNGRKLTINIGESTGGSQLLSKKLIKFITEHTNISSNQIELLHLPMDSALSQFEKNNIDMWIFVTAKPQKHMKDLLEKDYIHLVDFSNFDIKDLERSNDYKKTRIGDIVSLGVNATLITSQSTSNDNIEHFLKILRTNIRRITAAADADFPKINQLL